MCKRSAEKTNPLRLRPGGWFTLYFKSRFRPGRGPAPYCSIVDCCVCGFVSAGLLDELSTPLKLQHESFAFDRLNTSGVETLDRGRLDKLSDQAVETIDIL